MQQKANQLVGRSIADRRRAISGKSAAERRRAGSTFQWLARRLPPNSKIIVWTATFHAAKDATTDPDIGAARNLGSYIQAAYGRQAFALGFSTLAGSYRYSRKEPARPLPAAPPGSPESIALTNSDAGAVYLDGQRLHLVGMVPGRPLGTNYATTQLGSRARRRRRLPTAAAAAAHGWAVKANLVGAALATP